MGYIEIISLDNDGVTVKRLEELTADERLSLEVEVDLVELGFEESGLLCFECLKPIPSGLGHSYCDAHKPKTL